MTDLLEKDDIEQLDRSWKVIRSLWHSFVGSLAIYLFLCKFMEDELQPMENIIPLTTLKLILFGIAILTLFVANYARKAMLNADSFDHALSNKVQNPAVAKYMSALIVTMGLSESIGVAGVVLFYFFKDSATLYQFLILSSIAMFYFHPRKEELLQVAVEMKKSGRM